MSPAMIAEERHPLGGKMAACSRDDYEDHPENARIIGESLAARILLVVFIERRREVVRLISARRATQHERRRYEESEVGRRSESLEAIVARNARCGLSHGAREAKSLRAAHRGGGTRRPGRTRAAEAAPRVWWDDAAVGAVSRGDLGVSRPARPGQGAHAPRCTSASHPRVGAGRRIGRRVRPMATE